MKTRILNKRDRYSEAKMAADLIHQIEKIYTNASAFLQISIDTMAITALPLDCWLRERLKNWVQLSGHEGTMYVNWF
jgi:hypothetical protein